MRPAAAEPSHAPLWSGLYLLVLKPSETSFQLPDLLVDVLTVCDWCAGLRRGVAGAVHVLWAGSGPLHHEKGCAAVLHAQRLVHSLARGISCTGTEESWI